MPGPNKSFESVSSESVESTSVSTDDLETPAGTHVQPWGDSGEFVVLGTISFHESGSITSDTFTSVFSPRAGFDFGQLGLTNISEIHISWMAGTVSTPNDQSATIRVNSVSGTENTVASNSFNAFSGPRAVVDYNGATAVNVNAKLDGPSSGSVSIRGAQVIIWGLIA